MSLTISVTLDDDAVAEFLELYNRDAGVKITADMLNQNHDLHEVFATDMVNAWFDCTLEEDTASVYDMYSEYIEHDVLDEVGNEF